jgi:hypothetical protein
MASEEAAKINAPEPEVIDLTILSDSSSDGGGSNEPTNGTAGHENSSDTSEVEIHLNHDTRFQLKNVINTVSTVRLRQLLIDLVDTEQAVEIALTRELITLDRETQKIVPRYDVCQNCGEDYDTNTEREQDECEYHPGVSIMCSSAPQRGLFSAKGTLEVDECPGLRDEDARGPIADTEENRAEFPEKFLWTCCDEDGTSTGCVQGEHQRGGSRKRRRL